jgi:exosortase H (IPTLxxWG-CTERM-specific)
MVRRAVDQHAGRDQRGHRQAVRPPGAGAWQGAAKREHGFAVSIEAGCNGVEATIVLVAAVLAFPASWRRKLAGLAIGIVAVQGLNIVRVISLFYLGQWNFSVFEWAHLYVWQALIMLDVLVVWLLWVRTLPRPEPDLPAVAA